MSHRRRRGAPGPSRFGWYLIDRDSVQRRSSSGRAVGGGGGRRRARTLVLKILVDDPEAGKGEDECQEIQPEVELLCQGRMEETRQETSVDTLLSGRQRETAAPAAAEARKTELEFVREARALKKRGPPRERRKRTDIADAGVKIPHAMPITTPAKSTPVASARVH